MTDREKVLQALEHCDLCSDMPNCQGCAYLREPDCMEHLKQDITALLKAQEPIEARLHLCESCAKEYAECEADKADLVYGSGVGNDNIIGCPWYVNRWKAQKPRVMTLDEYRAIAEKPAEERVPVWLEWRGGSGRWTIPERAYELYGESWRCWTSPPTDAQREAEPWND